METVVFLTNTKGKYSNLLKVNIYFKEFIYHLVFIKCNKQGQKLWRCAK